VAALEKAISQSARLLHYLRFT